MIDREERKGDNAIRYPCPGEDCGGETAGTYDNEYDGSPPNVHLGSCWMAQAEHLRCGLRNLPDVVISIYEDSTGSAGPAEAAMNVEILTEKILAGGPLPKSWK